MDAGPSDGDAGGGPPAVPVCGDGWRDPATEECDEGAASTHTACTPGCVVVDFSAAASVSDAGSPSFHLSDGRHPIAAGSSGLGVVVTDETPALWFLGFGPKGDPIAAPSMFGLGSPLAATADPVVATLPGGAFAAAWADANGDGDALGVALQAIDPGNPGAAPIAHANTTSAFNQYQPDAVWSQAGLIVAWTDDSNPGTQADIRFRSFDASLAPTSAEQTLANTADAETDVALAPFGSSWAAAWRVSSAGFETLGAAANGVSWTVGPFLPAPTAERPTIVELDAGHLLVAFVIGDLQDPNVTRVATAVLDMGAPGVVPFAVGPVGGSQPVLARPGSRLYMAWRTAAGLGDPAGEEAWLSELLWDPNQGVVTQSAVTLALPRSPQDQVADQRRPRLASTSLFPEGAIAAAWEDLASGPAVSVRLELIPTPILRKAQP
jgi:hypothetical protein